ncbi:hypothetical protein D9M69_398760 [compost metagenome]
MGGDVVGAVEFGVVGIAQPGRQGSAAFLAIIGRVAGAGRSCHVPDSALRGVGVAICLAVGQQNDVSRLACTGDRAGESAAIAGQVLGGFIVGRDDGGRVIGRHGLDKRIEMLAHCVSVVAEAAMGDLDAQPDGLRRVALVGLDVEGGVVALHRHDRERIAGVPSTAIDDALQSGSQFGAIAHHRRSGDPAVQNAGAV